MKQVCAILLGLFIGGLAEAKVPEWAKKNTQRLSGKVFVTTCSGTGPSLDTARRDALDSCRLSARQQLATNIKVRSLTVQSEASAGFHEEVSENVQYEGLVCIPLRDEVEETDGTFRVWTQCRFDLSKVNIRPEKDPEQPRKKAHSAKELGKLRSVDVSKMETHFSDNFTLTVSVVPKCDSLIVRGEKPRQVPCTTNPMRVVLYESDKEILVRAAGYQPKTISVENGRDNAIIQVLLDKN
jgi:hypothetical protein